MIDFVIFVVGLVAVGVFLALGRLLKAIGKIGRFILPPKNVHTGKRMSRW